MRASILSFSVILVALAAAPSCATRSRIPDESNGSGGDAASSSGAGGQGGGGGVGGQGGMGGAGGQGGQGGAGGGGQGGAGGGSGMACGGFVGSVCGPTEFCDSPDKIACFPDAPGMCMPRPGSACPPDCPQVCGCDGKTYCSMCEANNAGFDALPGGPCK